MNDLKETFPIVKPLCDSLIVSPIPDNITRLVSAVKCMQRDVLQELQMYLMFPIVMHLKSEQLQNKHEIKRLLVDAMKVVLEGVDVDDVKIFLKYHNCLIQQIYDTRNPGVVSNVPEEIKLSVMETITVLMLRLTDATRYDVYKPANAPILGHSIFMATNIAKQEKLRPLRLAAISCIMAITATHDVFLNFNLHKDTELERIASDSVSHILPGILGGLRDVAIDNDNPGHAVTVKAVCAIHRITCLVMNDKYLKDDENVSIEDFAKIINKKSNETKVEKLKLLAKSEEWYKMAGEKLSLVSQSLLTLQTHEHWKVRKEIAVYCSRILLECPRTMSPSIPLVLDALIALAEDEYQEVSSHCKECLKQYFSVLRPRAMECLSDNFHNILTGLPRILNNIDNARKLSALNLLRGHIAIQADNGGYGLAEVVTSHNGVRALCNTLVEAVRLDTGTVNLLAHTCLTEIESPHLSSKPWCKLIHLDDKKCEEKIQDICRLLGSGDSSELIVDHLLDTFRDSVDDRREVVYLLNYIGSAPSNVDKTQQIKRIIETYIDSEVWYLPLDVTSSDVPLTDKDTLDVTVYNPMAWDKDSVPDLYEGATETRYTDISYQNPRLSIRDVNSCYTLLSAQNNMILSCLLTEGLGLLARRLGKDFQPFLLKTLCLILERVGSKYEMLHLAGTQTLQDVTKACGHNSVADLIRTNADYFTYQVTVRLKKSWNSESALQILIVVMQYSDPSILDCLNGIVTDVLVKSTDYYHKQDVGTYLQVFLTFVTCILKWFPDNTQNDIQSKLKQLNQSENPLKSIEHSSTSTDTYERKALESSKEIKLPKCSDEANEYDLLLDTRNFLQNQKESERLLLEENDDKKSAEDMFQEDLNNEDALDYDDKVTEEKKPLPQHITMTETILKRCLNFIPSKNLEEKLLSMQVLEKGFLILQPFEDELLPIVHLAWAPLVRRFTEKPAIVSHAFSLLVTMAQVAHDFIRNRFLKEVLHNLTEFLIKSSKDSYLKDIGSAYRHSQAYRLQETLLSKLHVLAVEMDIEDRYLDELLKSAEPYLSNRQPKPLQALAVNFFQTMLEYDYGATWQYLRLLCDNQETLQPPKISENITALESILGTPYKAKDSCYQENLNKIFKL